MCEMCERAGLDNPDREYRPVRLRCKTPTLAEAFRVIVIEMRGGMKTPDGSVMQPYTDGDTVVMPWAGHPGFVNAITQLATTTQVADPEAVREMTYGAMAQGMSTAVENVRNFGETIARAMTEFMRTVGSQRPIDVDSLLSTLDDEAKMLQDNYHDDQGDR